MPLDLFTVVSDYRGTTSSLQVYAADAQHAVLEWAKLLTKERHFGRNSAYIARDFQAWPFLAEATAIPNLHNVWTTGTSCGGDHISVTVVKTASDADRQPPIIACGADSARPSPDMPR